MGKLLNVKQVKQLEEKGWTVTPEAKYLNLFFDDFGNNSAWDEICDQLDVAYDVDSVSVLIIGVQEDHEED